MRPCRHAVASQEAATTPTHKKPNKGDVTPTGEAVVAVVINMVLPISQKCL